MNTPGDNMLKHLSPDGCPPILLMPASEGNIKSESCVTLVDPVAYISIRDFLISKINLTVDTATPETSALDIDDAAVNEALEKIVDEHKALHGKEAQKQPWFDRLRKGNLN